MVILDTKYLKTEGEKPKGRLQFSIYEDFIVQYTLSGPVDRLLVQHFELIHKEAVGKMKKAEGEWGSFVVFHDVSKISDGAVEEMEKYLSDLGRRGKLSTHMAVVYPDDLPISQMEKDAFMGCLVRVGVTCQSFIREEDALSWLRVYTEKG
jgi:hypothetical protein